ncbi:hypothetical protein C1645_760351 [Glomus cerebriforme]|uniref:Uncharacterized protein n=1 Tax=Glomus cerebriforme TaxID=658196 RepID=A0A397TBL3_9GLOM|nr:hypothetical protein C1645_760351 [Glomus cerebriforme]
MNHPRLYYHYRTLLLLNLFYFVMPVYRTVFSLKHPPPPLPSLPLIEGSLIVILQFYFLNY